MTETETSLQIKVRSREKSLRMKVIFREPAWERRHRECVWEWLYETETKSENERDR